MKWPDIYKIHAIMIVGDVGYDLKNDDCEQFVIWM